jgi:hypothetical protein
MRDPIRRSIVIGTLLGLAAIVAGVLGLAAGATVNDIGLIVGGAAMIIGAGLGWQWKFGSGPLSPRD